MHRCGLYMRCLQDFGWRGAVGLAVCASVLLMAGAPVGCTPVAQYRFLSFFFDGVPVPEELASEEPEKIIGPDGTEYDADDPRAREFLEADTVVPSEGQGSVEVSLVFHKPYEDRQCMTCHSPESSFQVPITSDVCGSCHEAYYNLPADDWTHGPVSLGGCSMCHVPHESPHVGLLTTASPGLCFDCHEESLVLAKPHHATAEAQGCNTCHDPHSAGNRKLLVDSNSYSRRLSRMPNESSAHNEWKRDTCGKCHSAEASNVVLSDVDGVCLSCHDQVRQPGPGGPLHTPVIQGKCTHCHIAHDSPLPNLINPVAEKNCIGCHEIDELTEPTHLNFRRADCLLCHAGHRPAEGDVTTCRKCHESYYDLPADDWVHGPMALEDCLICHEPRGSAHGQLISDLPDLCLSCHEAERVLAKPHHAEADTQACVDCHDPHSAGNRQLLIDSQTYLRRQSRMTDLPSGHDDWRRDGCTSCHVAQDSEQTIPNVGGVCLSCHEEVQTRQPGAPLHDPVVQGECSVCHSTHGSPLADLVRPVAENNCADCHPSEDLSESSHANMYRAECLLCHVGHRSLREGLLRPIRPALQDDAAEDATAPPGEPDSEEHP